MLKKVVPFLVLAAVLAAPVAFACNQRCNYATGNCEDVGWTTYMACDTWGGFCIDMPVSGCRGGATEPNFLSAEITAGEPVEAPTCTPTKGGDAN